MATTTTNKKFPVKKRVPGRVRAITTKAEKELSVDEIKKTKRAEAKDLAVDLLAEKAKKKIDEMKLLKIEQEKLKKEEEKKSGIEITGKEVTLNGYFKLELGTFSILKHNVKNNISTLLIGPTGLGKTDIAVNIATVLKVPITIFDMGTMTDPIMGLIGTHVIEVKDGKTYSEFKKSRFSEVIQKPGIVLLDEVNRAASAANNLLFPCLDFRRELPMEYSFGDTKPISVHPQCVFFATANIGSQYTGTHKLDRALIDRFMIIAVDGLSQTQTIATLNVTHPKLKDVETKKIVEIYNKINKEHDDFKIGFNLSIRHLKTVATLVQNKFTIYDAYYAICKGLGGPEGLKAIESILSSSK